MAERAERAGKRAAEEALAIANRNNSVAKSPSEYSSQSYELFVGQEKGTVDDNKEKMSIRSDTLSQGKQSLQSNKIRKVSAVSIPSLQFSTLLPILASSIFKSTNIKLRINHASE